MIKRLLSAFAEDHPDLSGWMNAKKFLLRRMFAEGQNPTMFRWRITPTSMSKLSKRILTYLTSRGTLRYHACVPKRCTPECRHGLARGAPLGLLLVFAVTLAFAQENFVYDGKGKRDPFMALVTAQGYIINIEEELFASDMNLEGVIFDPQGNSLAIINGKVVKAGDNIGVYTVTEINQTQVALSKDKERYVLELKKEVE